MSAKKALKVRGDCPACGHTVVTEAPADRFTWRGPCPKCGKGRVYASRIKAGDAPPPPPPDEPEQPPAAPAQPDPAPSGRPRRKVVKAGDYVRPKPEPKPRQVPAADVRPAGAPRPDGPAPARDTRTPEPRRDADGQRQPDQPADDVPAPPRARAPEHRTRRVTPYAHLGY